MSATAVLPPAPPRRTGLPGWAWALIVVFSLLFATLAGGLVWIGSWGLDLFKEHAIESMQADPVIAEHIGEIQSAHIDLMKTGTLPGAEEFAFRVVGSRGAGIVQAEFTSTPGGERHGNGTLRMDDGTTHRLAGTQRTYRNH